MPEETGAFSVSHSSFSICHFKKHNQMNNEK